MGTTEELRQKLAEYWAIRVTAVNPHVNRPADPRHPSELPFSTVQNTSDQCAACLNRFQYYCNCPRPVCKRVNKETGEVSCRFWYPRSCREEASVTRDIDHKTWRFGPARNLPFLNQYSPLFTMGWMANTDIQPATTLVGLVKYIAKYVSKPEKASMAYKDMESQVLKYTSDKSPLLSFTSKMLNKLVGERNYSAQEVSHVLLQAVSSTVGPKTNRTRR